MTPDDLLVEAFEADAGVSALLGANRRSDGKCGRKPQPRPRAHGRRASHLPCRLAGPLIAIIDADEPERQRHDKEESMLDHIGLNVSDYDRSRDFYQRSLAPVGFSLLMEPVPRTGGFGRDAKPWFWVTHQRRPTSENVHVAFTAPDRATVDAFHAAALEAGGTDNGAPGIRALYHPTYYGAYVLDPDGNNIEVVCHHPE
jgi:catechol 2,3-dioxygenase-like lactoylglutathione lyase family enzyme